MMNTQRAGLILAWALWPMLISAQHSIRFFGNGVNAPDQDRIKIQVDEVGNTNPGPPADIGAADFTMEWWMKASAADNTAEDVSCGNNINWIYGNILIDRDRYNQDRKFGISLAGGKIVFGVSLPVSNGDLTICGTTDVLDNEWHHIAIQRRQGDGFLWLFVDGTLDATASGPPGDLSYPDDGIPCSTCCGGSDCNFSDPFLVLGAEKHDAGSQFPSYNGFMDELRISHVLRYSAAFSPDQQPFETDVSTAALYHFDEGSGVAILDASNAAGGPSHGILQYGGSPAGPIWSQETPFRSCNGSLTNNWVGLNPGTWHGNANDWSLKHIPEVCHEVVIDSNAVSILEGEVGVAKTLFISLEAEFTVEAGGQLDIGSNLPQDIVVSK